MRTPPKIIDVEVTTEPVGAATAARGPSPAASLGGPPVHVLSALLLLVVDNLWNLADWLVIDWIITIPLSFCSVFFPVFVIQKLLKKDSFGRAFALALLLAVIAAVPTSVTGTPVGVALLAWTGIRKLFPLPASSSHD